MTVLLVVVGLSFAWSMGAHYTGACMGMPHALGALTRWQALALMAPLAWLGASLASHAVERTVADRLTASHLAQPAQVVVVGLAFLLTTAFTRLKVPTSTIQILVFCVVGVALGEHVGVSWATIGALALTWVNAPPVAFALGFALTKGLDRVPAIRGSADLGGPQPTAPALTRTGLHPLDTLSLALIAVGAGASFVMGSNDVANATGAFVATGTFSPLLAGVVGGAGLALGALTWGRPLLKRIAFEIVKLDRVMASAAQAVQAIVVLSAVSLGYFTSMNQALVGAMAGAGTARGRETVSRGVLTGILRGWAIGPVASFGAAFVVARTLTVLAGSSVLR